jgi:hypothetical protein
MELLCLRGAKRLAQKLCKQRHPGAKANRMFIPCMEIAPAVEAFRQVSSRGALLATHFILSRFEEEAYRCLNSDEGRKVVAISTNVAGDANSIQNAVMHDYEAERRLWIAVLMQAVVEWRSDRMRAKRDAEAFLFHNEKDFQMVCAGAGMDPSALRSQLLRLCRGSGTVVVPQPQIA